MEERVELRKPDVGKCWWERKATRMTLSFLPRTLDSTAGEGVALRSGRWWEASGEIDETCFPVSVCDPQTHLSRIWQRLQVYSESEQEALGSGTGGRAEGRRQEPNWKQE